MAGSMHILSSSVHWKWELTHLLKDLIERARLFWALDRARLYNVRYYSQEFPRFWHGFSGKLHGQSQITLFRKARLL